MKIHKTVVCRTKEHKKYKNERKKLMAIILIFMAALVVLGLIAQRWGFDSRDGFNSCEWTRKQSWPY